METEERPKPRAVVQAVARAQHAMRAAEHALGRARLLVFDHGYEPGVEDRGGLAPHEQALYDELLETGDWLITHRQRIHPLRDEFARATGVVTRPRKRKG